MKVKSFLLTALAASMTFVACDNNDNEMGQLDNTPKSVSINLPNVISALTRSAGQDIADATDVSLTDLQVFFTDGQSLVKGKTAEGTDATHYFSSKNEFDNRADAVFHFLPATVNKVIVVGNIGEESKETTYTGLQKDLAIADEQNEEDLFLYREVELTTSASFDNEGHPLYEVDVELEPRVARIEVGSFEYTAIDANTPRKYTSIEIDQIMLNNYYLAANNQTGQVTGSVNRAKSEITASTVFGIFEEAANAAPVWDNDVFSDDVDADPTTVLPVVTLKEGAYIHTYKAGNVRPAYHFFPKATNIANTDHPQVVVKLIGTDTNGNKTPLYLATDVFNPAVTTDMAKIYVLDFEFNDNDLSAPEKCVNVTVTVKKWNVEAVTPEF